VLKSFTLDKRWSEHVFISEDNHHLTTGTDACVLLCGFVPTQNIVIVDI